MTTATAQQGLIELRSDTPFPLGPDGELVICGRCGSDQITVRLIRGDSQKIKDDTNYGYDRTVLSCKCGNEETWWEDWDR